MFYPVILHSARRRPRMVAQLLAGARRELCLDSETQRDAAVIAMARGKIFGSTFSPHRGR